MRKMLRILGAGPLWRISLRPASAAASLAVVCLVAAEAPRPASRGCGADRLRALLCAQHGK